jgi:hypothetical protein
VAYVEPYGHRAVPPPPPAPPPTDPGAGFRRYAPARTAPWQDARGRYDRDGRDTSRRRRRAAIGLIVVAAAVGVYAREQVLDGAVNAGRSMGVITGDATALAPELVEAAAPGATGHGPLDPRNPEVAAGGDEGTVVTPGDDGLVGTVDDVVVPAGAARNGTATGGGPSSTTETTRPTTSTSTTLPPIPVDLAISGIEVPSTAAGSTDACGKDVAFDSSRLADDSSETAWRMDGDGSGKSLTLALDGSHRVVSVGLIPGYALVDPCDGSDRFAQNRRITKVTWQFDDGSAPVVQELRDAPEMQRVAVSAQATTVTLKIDGVTADPERDFTAISEIDVRGT